MEPDRIQAIIRPFTQQGAILESQTFPACFRIDSNDLVGVCRALYENPTTFFDMLSCVTGIDNGPDAGTMEVVYNLYSIPFNYSVMIKVVLPRANAEIESLTGIWKGANWLEREVYDMFGIRFKNHPDLRRILMPNDWEGYPLRKDYQHQEKYRDIQVKY